MEQLQLRLEERSGFVRGKPFADLGSVGGLEGPLPAKRATGSAFVPPGFSLRDLPWAATVVLYQLLESVRIWLQISSPSRSRMFSALRRQSFLSSNRIRLLLQNNVVGFTFSRMRLKYLWLKISRPRRFN